MYTKIRWYHWLLTLIITAISGILILGYGWAAFAIITERPGLNSSMFINYKLTKLQYSIYNGIVSLAGFYIICSMFLYHFKKDKKKLTKTFLHFIILIIL